jgi:hypothetical protein
MATLRPSMRERRSNMQGLFTLTPAESKRLLGKALAALPEVLNAKKNGYLLLSRGTTTAYVAEELLGEKIAKEMFFAPTGRKTPLLRGLRVVFATFALKSSLSETGVRRGDLFSR